MKGVMMLKALEGYIKELGYTALRGVVTPQAAGVAGGIGELGRNGLVINKNFGARIHMPDPILTDLPLVAGPAGGYRRRGFLQDLPQMRQHLSHQ